MCLPAIICAFHKLAGVFLQAKPNYRCRLPGEYTNATFPLLDDIWNSSFPWDERAKSWSQCTRYNGSDIVHCDQYIYDRSVYKSSAVIEVNNN